MNLKRLDQIIGGHKQKEGEQAEILLLARKYLVAQAKAVVRQERFVKRLRGSGA